MPYKIIEEDGKFFVVNSDTGERKNKKPLAKARAVKYMRALYAVEGGAKMGKKEAEQSLFIFKQADGRSRWVTFSSNAYRDRDKEIVSTKALEADCARADKEGDHGPLRWWHVGKPDPFAKSPGSGADIGRCDYNAMHGRILVESGTFTDERVAEAVKAKASDLQVSIGYFHPLTEPDGEGVFHNIRRFERSLLPRGRASNPWTSMLVVEKETDMISEKLQALKALLGGDDELVKTVLAEAEKAEKAAQESGVAFKENETPAPETPAVAVEPPVVETKAEEEAAETAETEAEDEGELEPSIGDMSPDEFAGMLAEAMGKVLESYQAEIKALKVGMTKKDDTEAALREALELQAAKIKELDSQLTDLVGGQPRAAVKGYRASQDEATVQKETSRVKGQQPTIDPAFREFLIGSK